MLIDFKTPQAVIWDDGGGSGCGSGSSDGGGGGGGAAGVVKVLMEV